MAISVSKKHLAKLQPGDLVQGIYRGYLRDPQVSFIGAKKHGIFLTGRLVKNWGGEILVVDIITRKKWYPNGEVKRFTKKDAGYITAGVKQVHLLSSEVIGYTIKRK